MEGGCRSKDYCGPDGEVKGQVCVKKDSGIKGAHCRFEFFGAPSCMDFRGVNWDSRRALGLCVGLNGGSFDAVLAPGPCDGSLYDTLCETEVASSLYLPGKVPSISFNAGEHVNLFAVGFPEVFCQPDTEQWIKGKFTPIPVSKAWDTSDWIPLDKYLEIEED